MNKVHILFIVPLLFIAFCAYAQPGDVPPNSEPGKCYAKCLIPDQYETITEQREVKAALVKTLIAVPEYESVTERIMVKSPSFRLVPVPAEYETVTEQTLIKEESKRLVVVPAEYETVTERILVKEESKQYFPVPPEFETVTNSTLYKGNPDGLSEEFGDLLSPNNPNNPNNSSSIFNPNNRDSPYNPNNTNSPYHPDSPYNPDNPNSLLNPNNPDSPFNPANIDFSKIGSGAGGTIAGTGSTELDEALEKAGLGTIMPYLIKEGSVRIERVPATYETISERIEVKPPTTKWVQRQADANCLSANPDDCLVWCLVEVPAEYKTINKQIKKGCENGYYFADDVAEDSREYCVKLVNIPPEYGVRTITVKAPNYREEVIPAEYTTVTRQVIKTPATVKEEIIPAEYKTVTKRVLKRPAYMKKEIIPGEYKTVTRNVRKGLKKVSYIHPTGTLLIPANPNQSPSEGDPTSGTFPTNVYPAAGYTLPNQATGGLAIPGTPGYEEGSGLNGKAGFGGGDGGDNNSGVNADEDKIPGGLPENYYTAGCPSGYRFDPLDNTCKKVINIPAEYETVSKRALTQSGGFTEWREVVCPNNLTSYTITQIQTALKDRGYDPGPIDNILGARTKAALTQFQKDNNLPIGQLDLETLKALGVQY